MTRHLTKSVITKGFTLLETLVAMVLIAVTATAFIMIQNRTWLRTKTSSRMMEAGNRIEQHIEKLRMTIAENPAANFPPADTAISDGRFNLKRTVSSAYSPRDTSLLANVRKLTLTVTWDASPNGTLSVATYVARDF